MSIITNKADLKNLSPDFVAGISTSFLIHIVFVLAIIFNKTPKFDEVYSYTNVSYEVPKNIESKQKEEQVKQHQIVTEPEKNDQKENDQIKKFLAEKESSAEKEQVKKGSQPSSPPAQPAPTKILTKVNPQNKNPSKDLSKNSSPSQAPPKSIKSLTLNRDSLLALNQKTEADSELEESESALKKDNSAKQNNSPLSSLTSRNARSLGDFRPFSRPSGSGAQFYGSAGTTDYLPNLPDGDITMLNAKADHFAVFVRRVATRVFAQLRSSGWEELNANEISALRSFTTITAELSLQGELLKIILESPSGSSRFDQIVAVSVKKGARDPHPPAQAVSSNGNIKFIFQSKSWVNAGYSSQSGASIERRWLLLGVGLE